MRFILEAEEIPQELIEAQNNNKLVIFAGAGISMGSPANLPSFSKLADKITQDSGLTRKKKEDIDRFLGKVANRNANDPFFLHKRVINEFKDIKSPNSIHEYILKLFKNNIRIVTTNFDELFNYASNNLNINPKKYYAPALPLGDNFEGIVYLHGCINDKPENLVLTDKDFAQAYIVRGWATEFVKKLFQEYFVLFIGYSYKDTILHYLTRGINIDKAYILTEEKEKNNLSLLNIKTITYDNSDKSYKNIELLLKNWCEYYSMDKLQERTKIINIANRNPNNIDLIDLNYANNHIFKKSYRIKLLLDNINNEYKLDWILYIFKNIQLEGNEQFEDFKYLLFWIVNNIIENDKLYNDNQYEYIIEYLQQDKQVEFIKQFKYQLKLYFSNGIKNKKIFDFWLHQLIKIDLDDNQGLLTLILEKCIEKDYEIEARILIRKLLTFDFNKNTHEIKHIAHKYYLQEIIKKNQSKLIKYSDTILQTVENCCLKNNELYLNETQKNDDVYYALYLMDDISQLRKINYDEYDIKNIFYITKISIDEIIKNNPNLAISYIYKWLNTSSYLLNRYALYMLINKQFIPFNSVISILIQKCWFKDHYYNCKELMDYFKNIFPKLSETEKEDLLGEIITFEKQKCNKEYLVLKYLHTDKTENKILPKYLEKISKYFSKEDRDIIDKRELFPQNQVEVDTMHYACVYDLNNILKLKITPEIISKLKKTVANELIGNYKFKGNHESFLEHLVQFIKKDYRVGIKLLKALFKYNDYDIGLFTSIFRGLSWSESFYKKKSNVNSIINLIYKNIDKIKVEDSYMYIINIINNILKKVINNELAIFTEIEYIKTILNSIWNTYNFKTKFEKNIYIQALNNVYGEIIIAYLNLFWIEYNKQGRDIKIFEKYLNTFEEKISDNNKFKSKMALSILMSNLFFIYKFNKEWAKNKLIVNLDYNNKNSTIAWNSFLYANPKLSVDNIIDLLPYFNKIIKKNPINKIDDSQLNRFYELYSYMYLYSLIYNKKLASKFTLRELFKDNTFAVQHWYRQFLIDSENIIKNKQFNIEDSLYEFFESRIVQASNEEKEQLLFMVLYFEKHLRDSINILKSIDINSFDSQILFEIQKLKLDEEHPIETIDFLNIIINPNTYNCLKYDFELEKILKTLKKIVNNDKTFYSLLEKIVSIDAYYDWAYELM